MDGERDGRGGDLTPVERRRLRAGMGIQECPSRHIAYQHTVLCQTALPYRNPGDGVRVWQRDQGMASLRVEAGAARDPETRTYVELGLPYGSRPRLILAHLNREALLRGSPRIDVEASLTAFVRRIQHTDPNGKEIRRFKDQLSRLAVATVRLSYDISDERAFQINAQIITAIDLWNRTADGQRVLWPSEVCLSQDYFESLRSHAVPLDERAIASFANSPLALDVYCWLAQRLHRVTKNKPQFISWTALYGQFGSGYTELKFFRRKFLQVLRAVHSQYQAARVDADGLGLTLRHSPPPVSARLAPAAKPLG